MDAPPPPPPSYEWRPTPPAWPGSPGHRSPAAPRNSRAGGIAGAAAAGFAAFFKYGVFLLKVGKIAPTLISMAVALVIYALFFGPAFGLGIVVLILIHELGHVAFSAYERVPMSMPVFLGPFGAVTRVRQPFRDARQEAVIALGGPLTGTAASLACFALAEAVATGYMHFLLLALAYFGCFINLFNLVPMSPLDGGRIASGISVWMNVLGLVIMGAIVLFFGNPFALLILIIGVITTMQRVRAARRGALPPPLPPRTRAIIGTAYIAMLLIAAGGMTVAHNAEVNGHYVPGITQSSGSA